MSERGEIQIDASVATKVTFASHQNAIPILQELKLVNPTLEVLEMLELEIWSDPQFLQPKKWIIDRLSPNTTVNISDRDVALNASFLLQVHESLTGTVHIVLSKDGVKQSEAIKPVEILAKTEWGGAAAMPELLAAFVTPNDPAVDEVLKAASKVLASAGKPDGINGYESGSRTRVWELVSAVWSAVAGYRLTYALPPASFETQGQKTRSPSAILASGLATCLDNALLFAAAFEQAGLNPIIVLTKGHAMVGVWLQPQEFNQLIVDDPGTVRKRVALKELVIFETTLVTQKPPPSFSVAVSEGDNQISPGKEGDFVLALDIRRARMQRLRPVALQITDSTTTENSDAELVIAESLEAAPSLPAFDVAPEEIKPTSAAGRLDQWQRKLLDLTAGNRLLNVRPSATTLRIVCPDPARLEDKLADGAKIRIVAQPPIEGAGAGGRDANIHQVRTGERLLDEYARAALDRDEVLTTLDAKTLDASLVELYRKARLDLQEGGANTLFLALGFLNWKRPDTDAKTYRAPLILLPVTLERKSALSGVRMIAHEDEPRFNLTLLQMLQQDFELSIPELEGSLPADDSGVDVPNVWNIVRRAVRDIPGFEVVEEMVLGTFSFAKYLMWKDLVDRTDALKASDVVRHLIDTPREPFICETLIPRPEDLDRIVDPSELFAPLPADSSQLAAVVASGKRCNFVLDGPPGTGKSQTIANIIAHNMALGRKVLFVAEKMAALDVVYRRLEERRLGAFCLELHSHKATKADVLAQLGRAWDTRDNVTAAQWREKAAELKYLRDTLNEIVELLHARHSNGLSLHEAVGRAIRDFDIRTPLLAWDASSKQNAEKLRAMREAARRLDVNFKAIEDLDPNAFGPITVDDWSNAWQSDIVAVTTQLARTLPTARQAFASLIERLSLPIAPANREQLTTIDELARLLPTLVGLDVSVAFGNDGTKVVDYIDQAIQRLNAYRLAERSLSVPYPSESVRLIPVLVLQAKLAEADIALWPLSLLKRIAVRKELQRSAGLAAKPTLRNDLPALATMLAELRSLDELGAETSKLSAWRGLGTDVPFLIRTREAVAALRSISARLATSPEILSTIRHRLGSVCVEGNELLGEAMPIAKAAATYHATFTALIADLDQFCNVAKCPAPFDGVDLLAATELLTDHVLARRASLKAWCDWRRARGLAVDLDLKVLVDALERAVFGAGEAEEQFEIAYARWWAGVVIDAEPRLRSFVPIEHADRIAAFRKLDDQLSELTVQYIRAKIAGEIPARDEVKRDSGYGVLRHELTKRMRHKPVRQLASEIGSALTTLTPCLLMSPLSIAQYLPAGTEMFDLVIFDEASQITTWDAIGAIARGKQVIIAGDLTTRGYDYWALGHIHKRTAIEALSARRAVIEDADNSLPRRDAERAQHYKRARDLLDAGELSGSPTELGPLLPSIVKRKQVSLLADRGRALIVQDNTLKNAATATEEEVRLAQERLSAGEVPADLAALNAALLAADTLGDIRSEIATRTRTLGARAKTSRDNIIGLGLSQGDAAALRQLKVPSEETINRFRQTFAAADAGKTAHAAELARLRQELEDIGERIEKLGRGGAVATKEELDASRATRDATWARVREIFIDESAEHQTIVADGAPGEDLAAAFERQEADADQVADAIIAHTKEAAELSLATHQKAETAKKITAAEIAGENVSDGWKALTDEWTGLWPIGSVSILSPIEMADWLKERQVLLREDIEQQAERDVIAGLEAKETQARTSLIAVLKPLAPINDDSPLMAARAQARALVNAAASTASKHAKASEAVESAQQRKRKADLACGRNANEIVEWSVAWKTALREAGLKETLAIDAAVTILDIMTALDGIKLQIDDLSHRIDTMTDSKAAFDAALASLGPLVAGFDGLSGTEICRQLETRLESAKANENTLRRLNEQRGIRTDAQHQASERLNRSNAALKALCAAAGCDDVDALTQIEQASITKQAALQEREGLEKRMLQDGSGLALSALLSECDGFEGDALPGRIALLNEQRGDVAVTIEKALTDRATLKAAFDALFGTNQAAETLQDAANVEAEIAILAQEYVDLTLQELALRQSIDLYRDRNQGPILGRAKILFSQLTDGVYSGLRADVDEDDEAVLIAEHATRGSLEISALSDGTVDPLYLALRLAVVQEHNATHEPLPFVADDLLLALDNTRATSTLRALGSFAETGQVLFFTHHEHMVALARAILPTGLLTEHRL